MQIIFSYKPISQLNVWALISFFLPCAFCAFIFPPPSPSVVICPFVLYRANKKKNFQEFDLFFFFSFSFICYFPQCILVLFVSLYINFRKTSERKKNI